MAYFLGVDSGGTRAEFVLGDEERVLALAVCGSLKRLRVESNLAAEHLEDALRDLRQRSGISMRQVSRTFIGTSGYTVPLVTDWLQRQFSARVGGELIIDGDVIIALDAAFPNSSGVLVLAGTGSNVAGRNAAGQVATVGGHGPVLADQGSGHRIGQQALRELFLTLDEQRESTMLAAFLEHWRLSSVDDIVAYANSCAHTEFSQLVPLVLACAQAGDAAAARVLAQEGRDLAHLALLMHARIARTDGAAWRPQFAFAGSILAHVAPVRQSLEQAIQAAVPDAQCLPGVVHPVMGALWRARHA